jgi:hypothetical protein
MTLCSIERESKMVIFGRHLSIEYRLGVGIDLEFSESRPVVCWDTETDELEPMLFQGTILHLPLCLVSYGRVYVEVH